MTFAVVDSSKTLEVLLAAAVTIAPTYTAVYADHSTTSFAENSFQGAMTNTNNTATTVASSPSSGVSRLIRTLTVFNNDASASITVTPRYNVSGNYYPIDKQSIPVGGRYIFNSSYALQGAQGSQGQTGPTGNTGAAGQNGVDASPAAKRLVFNEYGSI